MSTCCTVCKQYCMEEAKLKKLMGVCGVKKAGKGIVMGAMETVSIA